MKNIEYLRKNGVDVDSSLKLFDDDKSIYDETILTFHKGIDGKLEQIDKYFKDSDMANYAIYVHSLKSDCKYFGFLKLANIAYEHEMKSKENDLAYVKKHYKELTDEAQKVKTIVNEYLRDEEATETLYTGIDVQVSEALSTPVEEIVSSKVEKEEVKVSKEEPVETEALIEDIILVADDSEVIRIFVKKIFDIDYELAFAENGEEALEVIKAHQEDNRIKAILLDLNMPKKDGFAVLDYLKENNLLEKMPVTVISGDSSKESISKAFNYNIVDMLNKPFNEQKIKNAIEKTINQAR